MKVLAIIAEYNPMHNGHIYQINEAKKAINPDFCIAIMSGNFTQRGEPALLSKWERASIAVSCGLDLILELPAAFACNNSEYFAKGSVEILNRLGVITHLVFGSESGNLDELQALSTLLVNEDSQISAKIKEFSKNGISHFEARKNALQEIVGEKYANLMLNSNDILAIEYLRQLKLTNSSITPFTIKREGSSFNSSTVSSSNFLSATAIRTLLKSENKTRSIKDIENHVPASTFSAISTLSFEYLSQIDERYFTALGAMILNNESALPSIFSVTEGIENRICRYFSQSASLSELKDFLYSKRYAKSRINRILSHILLGLTKESMALFTKSDLYYARILAFNESARFLLREIKKNKAEDLPLITNLSKEASSPALQNNPLLMFDIKAGNIYSLLCGNRLYGGSDFVNSPKMR